MFVGVEVAVSVFVGVVVGVTVFVAVIDGVGVSVAVFVGVIVGVIVEVGVGVKTPPVKPPFSLVTSGQLKAFKTTLTNASVVLKYVSVVGPSSHVLPLSVLYCH